MVMLERAEVMKVSASMESSMDSSDPCISSWPSWTATDSNSSRVMRRPLPTRTVIVC